MVAMADFGWHQHDFSIRTVKTVNLRATVRQQSPEQYRFGFTVSWLPRFNFPFL
jgi:dynactin complex subunit